MPSIRARLATRWQDAAPLRAALSTRWQDAAPVRSRGSAYARPALPPGAVEAAGGDLAPALEILPAVDYPLATTWAVVDMRTDEPLPVVQCSFKIDDESAMWEGSLQGPYALLEALEAGEQPAQVRIDMGGQSWALVIDSVDEPQAFASKRVSASGRSLVALAGAPHSLATSWTVNAPTTAAQLASAAQNNTGLAIAWEIDSWLIPAGAWSGSGTPLDLVRQVAAAVRAVVEPDPAGFGVSVRSRYPVMPNKWASTPPDVQVAWTAVFSANRSQADQPEYTAVYLAGQQQGAVGQVRLAGTSGADHAPMVTDPLLTDIEAIAERGKAVLAASGKARLVQRTLPVLTGAGQPGVLMRGQIVRWVDPNETWCGLVRAVSVSCEFGRVRQTVTCERRLSFPAGTYVPPPVAQLPLCAPMQSGMVKQAQNFGGSVVGDGMPQSGPAITAKQAFLAQLQSYVSDGLETATAHGTNTIKPATPLSLWGGLGSLAGDPLDVYSRVVNATISSGNGRFNTTANVAGGKWYECTMPAVITLTTPQNAFGCFITDAGDFDANLDIEIYSGATLLHKFEFPRTSIDKPGTDQAGWFWYIDPSRTFDKVRIVVIQADPEDPTFWDGIGVDDVVCGLTAPCRSA